MVAKKTPVKKASPKKSSSKAATTKRTPAKKTVPMQSFRVYKNKESFTTFKITRQTVYWTILLAFIIITQLWILKIQLDIVELTAPMLSQ